MAIRRKSPLLAFVTVVVFTILSIMYHLKLQSSTFPVRSPPEIPNPPVEQSFRQSINISDAFSDSLVAAMRNERQHLIRDAREKGVSLTAGGELFRLFPPRFTCPYKEERLGGQTYGKWACGLRELYGLNKTDIQSRKKSCVMYSFGVGPEVAFDEAVLKITNCKVFAYDHTVNGIPSRTNESRDPTRMVYQKIGVEEYKNQNITYLKSIKQLMKLNIHDWIDILKVDVEGAEYGSLNMLMDDFEDIGILPFDQLLVEVHVFSNNSVHDQVIPWFNRLEAMGLMVTHTERNPHCACFEYNFVNVRGKVFRNSTFSFFKNG